MRLKTKLLFIAALFVLALPMVLTIGSPEAAAMSTQGSLSGSGTLLAQNDLNGMVQGKVTLFDWCSGTVFIDDVGFKMGDTDWSQVQDGYSVKAIYSDTSTGKVIKAFQVISGGDNR
jgi:hypothetical protein